MSKNIASINQDLNQSFNIAFLNMNEEKEGDEIHLIEHLKDNSQNTNQINWTDTSLISFGGGFVDGK